MGDGLVMAYDEHAIRFGSEEDAMRGASDEILAQVLGISLESYADARARLEAEATGAASALLEEPLTAELLQLLAGRTVVGLGDSITSDRAGWFEILRRAVSLCRIDPVVLENAGRSGDGSAAVMARLDRDVLAFDPDLVLVLVGTNDARRHGADAGKPLTSEAEFEANVSEIVRRCSACADVVLVEPPPVTTARGTEPLDGVFYWRDAEVERRASIVGRVAARQRIRVARVHAAFADAGPLDELLRDGLHPNDRGHTIILRSVLDAVR